MGVYIYNLRKATRNVNVDGEFVTLPTFKYAYKYSASGSWGDGDWGRRYKMIEANAERTADAAWEAFGSGPMLAVDADSNEVWLITRPLWEEEVPGIRIGKMAKVNGRWQCVAQETTAELAFNSLGYDYDEKTGKATKQVVPA